jgi:hypothetical protein
MKLMFLNIVPTGVSFVENFRPVQDYVLQFRKGNPAYEQVVTVAYDEDTKKIGYAVNGWQDQFVKSTGTHLAILRLKGINTCQKLGKRAAGPDKVNYIFEDLKSRVQEFVDDNVEK